MILMRQARPQDADSLLAWRNDPVTLAASRSTAPISREEHGRWMQFHALGGYPAHLVMIAEETDLGAVGTVRFDIANGDVMSYDVSITVAPEYRGRGFATPMLDIACRFMEDTTINAEVRRSNIASQSVFINCGFKQTGSSSDFFFYRREPEA